MANTNSKTKHNLTFAISYGFVGGKAHGKKLVKLMNADGFSVSTLDDADIIIAHSAGCWLIPPSAKPKLVIYIGMPLSQSRPYKVLLAANLKSFKSGNFSRRFRVKTKSTYYGLRQPKRNLGIVRMAKTAQPVIFPDVPSVFIANRHDPWPRSEKLQKYLYDHGWAFISLPGSHDHIWERPEYYVEIIDHYARLLA